MLTGLDHVNIHTDDIQGTADWYESVLGLRQGPRPDFPMAGAWIYLGDTAVIHLVLNEQPLTRDPASLEHFAFRAEGMAAFEEKLSAKGVPFERQNVPGTDIVQFNLHDPMGNHLHIDFREGP